MERSTLSTTVIPPSQHHPCLLRRETTSAEETGTAEGGWRRGWGKGLVGACDWWIGEFCGGQWSWGEAENERGGGRRREEEGGWWILKGLESERGWWILRMVWITRKGQLCPVLNYYGSSRHINLLTPLHIIIFWDQIKEGNVKRVHNTVHNVRCYLCFPAIGKKMRSHLSNQIISFCNSSRHIIIISSTKRILHPSLQHFQRSFWLVHWNHVSRIVHLLSSNSLLLL